MAYLNYKKLPYYLQTEVVVHNKPDDIWISINRRVLNITPMIQQKLLENPKVYMKKHTYVPKIC